MASALARPAPLRADLAMLQRRAVDAAIWGMPIVSVDAMREAFTRDARARYGDIVFWSKPADWKNQTTTPNASSLYVYFNFNTKNGPVVLELPAALGAGLFGTLLDAWQTPLVDVGPKGDDRGKGGKYLLLPPDFKRAAPTGYIQVHCPTYNGYALLRAIPESSAAADTQKALELIKQVRLHSLAAANPAGQRFIDMTGKMFDGIVRYDDTFYARLARIVGEEFVQSRDLVAMGLLRSIGIRKDEPFEPDAATRAVLAGAAAEAHAGFMRAVVDELDPFWPSSRWGLHRALGLAARTGFSFQTADRLDVDARAPIYFLAYAPAAKLGEATFYLVATYDGAGGALTGENAYVLRVPADVPAKQFWSVTVYDLETAGFFREAARVGVDSYDRKMRRNADGSIDVHFGPKAPADREANWIFTPPRKRWFAMFRFYGPDKALFDKKWTLPDIAKAA